MEEDFYFDKFKKKMYNAFVKQAKEKNALCDLIPFFFQTFEEIYGNIKFLENENLKLKGDINKLQESMLSLVECTNDALKDHKQHIEKLYHKKEVNKPMTYFTDKEKAEIKKALAKWEAMLDKD